MSQPPPQQGPPRILAWIGIVVVFFAAVAPTLSWLEFSGGMENLNIATALELRRDHPGDWLIPTLEGEPRVKKPPLTAWITAAAIRPRTVADLSSRDPAVRDAAADALAWEVRWPSLLAACLMLVATYELGRAIADPSTGLVAAFIGGTTLMFLKFGRSAMIDVHLGLWVVVANVFLAHAILRGRRWTGCLGTGAAMGIAFLLKGPVGWVQCLVPALVYAVAVALHKRPPRKQDMRRGFPIDEVQRDETAVHLRSAVTGGRGNVVPWIAPVLVAALLLCAIALPWFIYIAKHVPAGLDTWKHEAVEERGEKPSSIFGYLALLPYILPWTISFIGGLINARRATALAAVMAVLPLVVMSFYKDRKERYMYPMTGAAAVVAAGGIMTLARKREPWTGLDHAAVVQHWVLLVAFGLLLPAAAAATSAIPVREIQTVDGTPWLTRQWGAGLTVAMGLVIAGGLLIRRRWPLGLVGTTVVVMLVAHAVAIHGYARTENGLSPMRPLARAIWAAHPDARMYNAHPRGKRASVDLSIYMNRVTEWVSMEELAALKPGPRTKVVVMLQDPNGPPPAPPAGWRFLEKVRRDKDHWWAFALDAAR